MLVQLVGRELLGLLGGGEPLDDLEGRDPEELSLPVLARRQLSVILRQLAAAAKRPCEVAKESPHPAALSLACWTGNLATIDRLLAAGADPNGAVSDGRTALVVAIKKGLAKVSGLPEF